MSVLIQNEPLLSGFLGWFIAQNLKVVIILFKDRKIDFKMLVSSGGMPSSHTATVVATSFSVGLVEGFGSALFAACAVFSTIVMYDASGVRRAAGLQAEVLNQIMNDVFFKHKFRQTEHLKELLGHTPFQVFGGMILGIVVALWIHNI